jgi:hypothetical protein
VYDYWAENPRREFDCNIGKFAVRKSCKYADDEANLELEFCSREDDEKALDANKNIVAYLPVYVYDHSGARMNTTGFSCPWDSGQIGWIIAFKDTIKSLFPSWKISTQKRRESILEWLRGEVETYSAYMSGEVYGFQITENADPDDPERGDIIDSCWGYYGDDGIKAIREEYPEFKEELA